MKKFIRFLFFLLLFVLLFLIYGRYIGTKGLITKEYSLYASVDETFSSLKIVHFSDLHFLRVNKEEELKKVIKEINTINPDIVFFTGDLIDKDYEINDKQKKVLIKELKNINSKYGKYAILGNHDAIKDISIFEEIYKESDFKLLQNEYDIIYGNNNDKLFIGGLSPSSFKKANIDKVMEYFNTNKDINYKIILIHEPDYIDTILNKYKINLVLSGHSHNGQVNIPYLKKFFMPKGCHKYYENYYKVKDTDLYISSGIGLSRINFRIFNKPSINFYRINQNTE